MHCFFHFPICRIEERFISSLYRLKRVVIWPFGLAFRAWYSRKSIRLIRSLTRKHFHRKNFQALQLLCFQRNLLLRIISLASFSQAQRLSRIRIDNFFRTYLATCGNLGMFGEGLLNPKVLPLINNEVKPCRKGSVGKNPPSARATNRGSHDVRIEENSTMVEAAEDFRNVYRFQNLNLRDHSETC